MHNIAATITAPGAAAVSITRISGNSAWDIARKILSKYTKCQLTKSLDTTISLEAGQFKLAWLVDPKTGEHVDQVLVLAFKAPHSYTGEDLIEIQSHGGPYITNKILELCLEAGARLAKAGEFTERAFLNQRLDLSQAESIMDLINSRTSLASKNAIKLYEGKLGEAINKLRLELLDILGGLTAGIDFPDEVGDYDTDEFKSRIATVIQAIDSLLDSAHEGRILREGFKVAIIGKPNAGKSSLLNALLEDERAIVTDIPGTTRDLIEETISIKGLPVVLMDTAGIRKTRDLVEQLGVKRSQQAATEADLVLLLEELGDPDCKFDIECIAKTKILKIGTKLDLTSSSSHYDLCISATTKINLDKLKELIFTRAIGGSPSEIKINERQADLLRRARLHLEQSLQAAQQNLAQDFWTIDLKSSVEALGQITGAVLTEELLDNIFARFCIGK